MNALTLSTELASSLSDCEVGAEETLYAVTVKVTKNDNTGFEAEVQSVDYDAPAAAEEEEAAEETPVALKEKGPSGNPAIMLVLGKNSGK